MRNIERSEPNHVSHGAPYRHFESKEDLLAAIQIAVENEFADALMQTLINNKDQNMNMVVLGQA